MKDFLLWLAFLTFFLVAIPLFVFFFFDKTQDIPSNELITLYNHKTNTTHKINLEEYLIGVVSAEMPVSFSEEALKAQCIAARTFALRKINSGTDAHPDSDLCTDYAHCQAYYNTSELQKNWGKNYKQNISKIKKAVSDTKGEYLCYEDDIAVTVFHSCSNGITEKSSDVWGGEIPYLTNVSSEGDYKRDNYCVSTEFTIDEFISTISEFIGSQIDDVDELSGDIAYTAGNNVDYIILCEHKFKGTDVRKMFDLRSTAFDISFFDDKVVFNVYGHGHGVGMSQYGADYMGKNGTDYIGILEHYYPGTELVNMYK